MRIGIYGGTFNPIHLGHIHILQEFIRRLSLQRVLLIPTRVPPHKQVLSLASAEDRAAMCRLAAKELPEAEVELCTIELRREGKSYTAETLEELSRQYPTDQLYLLMGEDMFLTVDHWYHPETIYKLSTLCASPRSTDGLPKLLRKKEELERDFGAKCRIEDISYFAASSTEVRALAAENKEISGLVPPPVADYIRTHGIYQEETSR